MIVGVGNRSNKEYTAIDKLKMFKESVSEIVKERARVDEIVTASKDSVNATIEYWIQEYMPDDEPDKKAYEKQMKELFKIRIKEAEKQDLTVRLAFENEAIMEEEAKG